jgi:hypothetical protein
MLFVGKDYFIEIEVTYYEKCYFIEIGVNYYDFSYVNTIVDWTDYLKGRQGRINTTIERAFTL